MLAPEEQGGAFDALQSSAASEIVELIALTSDEGFLQTLRDAVGPSRRIWHVPTPDKVSDLLIAGGVRILVLDAAALHGGTADFVHQIRRQFPDLVLLVAGTREDETAVAASLSSGAVYRFIHKPVSPARARLFIETAIKRVEAHAQPAASAAGAGGKKTRPGWLIPAGIAGAVALAAALWGVLSHHASREPTPPAASAALIGADTASMQRAADALAANRLTAPSGDNALELYTNALARAPGDAQARAGIAEVHERLLARAENALLEERLDEAQEAIETARRAGVEHGRIAFLTAQLAKSRELLKLTQARAHPAAGERAAVARTPDVAHNPDRHAITETAERTTAAQTDHEQLLSLANERLQQDRLIAPANDSAKYYLAGLRAADPKYAGLSTASQDLQDRLLTKARRAASLQQYDAARTWLSEAEGLGSSTAEAAAIRAQIDQGASRQSSPTPAPAAEPSTAGSGAMGPGAAGSGAAGSGTAPLSATSVSSGAAPLSAPSTGSDAMAATPVRSPPAPSAAPPPAQRPAVVGAAALKLISKVDPVYPPAANAHGISGWVELEFTVGQDGRVSNVVATRASPEGMFDSAAIAAVSRWRFAPIMSGGAAVEQRARLRVRFAD